MSLSFLSDHLQSVLTRLPSCMGHLERMLQLRNVLADVSTITLAAFASALELQTHVRNNLRSNQPK